MLVRKQPDISLTYYMYGIDLLCEVDENDDPVSTKEAGPAHR